MRVLVTGGAGYIGTCLLPALLERKYQVRVLDNLVYGGSGLLPYFSNRQFEFIRGSVLDGNLLTKCMRDVDLVIPLAGIVGYPACKRNPELATATNYKAIKHSTECLTKEQKLIFPSTTSCYGDHPESTCYEDTPLEPVSIYGKSKADAEEVVNRKDNTVTFRLATAFGLSPRMRLDLLINDFTFQALKLRQLVVFERNWKRCFMHVHDIVRTFLFAIDNFDKMRGEVYNVGSPNLNLRKEDVVEHLQRKLRFIVDYADEHGHDEDQRNYFVSFDKLKKLGFSCEVGLDEGLDELIRGFEVIDIKNPYSNV